MPDVKLFGRKMRERADGMSYSLGPARVGVATWVVAMDRGFYWFGEVAGVKSTSPLATPHAAARALERKIRAAHARLGKLIDGKKGRGK